MRHLLKPIVADFLCPICITAIVVSFILVFVICRTMWLRRELKKLEETK